MSDTAVEEEKKVPKKDFRLFGKNISEVACFRNSFICGICTGVGSGLITFMLTSKARLSSHVAFGSLWLGVFAYWIPCRYNYESTLLVTNALKQRARLNIKTEENDSSEESSNSSDPDSNKK